MLVRGRAGRDHHQERIVGDHLRQEREHVVGAGVRPVPVLQQQDQRLAARSKREERDERFRQSRPKVLTRQIAGYRVLLTLDG